MIKALENLTPELLEKRGYKVTSEADLGWTRFYEHPQTGHKLKAVYGPRPHDCIIVEG
jgi:hypothetical protein